MLRLGGVALLFLGLQLRFAASARSLSAVPSYDPPIKHLPCDEEGCIKGVENEVYAFSALHDVALREVAIFVDMAMGEQESPYEFEVECLYWKGDHESSQPVKAAAKAEHIFDDKLKYEPYVVRCPDPIPLLQGLPRWVSFARDGKDMGFRLRVEQVSLERKGNVGACNAVVYTNRFEMLYEWFSFYSNMGVDGFEVYFSNQTVQWDGPAAKRQRRTQETHAHLPQPFGFPRVSWTHFDHLPLEERLLYSQQTVYNDCVYRNRHAYEYILMFDMDEFLIIRDIRYQGRGGLKKLLDHVFPPLHAAVGVYRYAYRDDCGAEATPKAGSYVERFTHRLKDTESQSVLNSKHLADKLIIKPDRVDIFYMHFLASARKGFLQEAMNTQPAVVFLKHLRSYGHDCSELTTDTPFDQE